MQMTPPAVPRADLSLAAHGAAFFPAILTPAEVARLRDCLATSRSDRPGRRLYVADGIGALLAPSGKIGRLATALLQAEANAVRAILFDKSAASNWALGWHQDRTIAVRVRVEVAGFGPWTVKSGTLHVEPPFAVIRDMITLRLHLDDVDDSNAPLLIAPGSQALGRIPAAEIPAAVNSLGCFTCTAQAGDVWAYSTGILHASNRADPPRRRRVLQVDFTSASLPGGLEWAGIASTDIETAAS